MTAIANTLPASANGYVLEVEGTIQYAAWAAPYFVLSVQWDYDEFGARVPGSAYVLLIHCEDADHARRMLKHGGRLLDSCFVEIDASCLDEAYPLAA